MKKPTQKKPADARRELTPEEEAFRDRLGEDWEEILEFNRDIRFVAFAGEFHNVITLLNDYYLAGKPFPTPEQIRAAVFGVKAGEEPRYWYKLPEITRTRLLFYVSALGMFGGPRALAVLRKAFRWECEHEGKKEVEARFLLDFGSKTHFEPETLKKKRRLARRLLGRPPGRPGRPRKPDGK